MNKKKEINSFSTLQERVEEIAKLSSRLDLRLRGINDLSKETIDSLLLKNKDYKQKTLEEFFSLAEKQLNISLDNYSNVLGRVKKMTSFVEENKTRMSKSDDFEIKAVVKTGIKNHVNMATHTISKMLE